ncbi:MAG: Hsp20/alpha crystallin family protein [Chitinispirillaceae bacterium]|nr:Hsp20/alpha crystallin family protein [Chitinispirillaceae bacterium]
MKSLIPWTRNKVQSRPVRFDDWLDGFRNDPFEDFLPTAQSAWRADFPSIDVSEDGKEVTVRAEIPGMSEKNLSLTFHNGMLTIRGEKKQEKEEKGKNRYYRECSYGSFERSVAIGGAAMGDKAKAKYQHGVLTVTIPKKEIQKKAIPIQTI